MLRPSTKIDCHSLYINSCQTSSTYGTPGHGKGVIDAMSSLGMKNVLCHDIVTQDVFFNTCEEIYYYLTIKNPNFCYKNISAKIIVKERGETEVSKEFPNCMKQHQMIIRTQTLTSR